MSSAEIRASIEGLKVVFTEEQVAAILMFEQALADMRAECTLNRVRDSVSDGTFRRWNT